jgi:broad specificity phosphatase PhoE
MKLAILRHGQTNFNVEHRYTGTTDVPLNETGRAEARAAGAAPWVNLVYTSPLRRARETAAIRFPHAVQRPVRDLQEMHFGRWQGHNRDELAGDAAFDAWYASGWALRAPGGESRGDQEKRVAAALARIVADAEAAGSELVVVAAHGGVVMSTCDALLSEEEKAGRGFHDWRPKNASLTVFDVGRTPQGGLALSNVRMIERTADLATC